MTGEDGREAVGTGLLDPPVSLVSRRARRSWRLTELAEVRWASVSLALLVVAVIALVAGAPGWVVGVAFAGCYVAGGWQPALAGLHALRERTLDVDLLMIVAALAAAAIGEALDGAVLVVIFATSGALEAVATQRTQESVRGLLELAPEQASRLGPDGVEEVVDAGRLEVGDRVLVRPGERVGADGVVVDGGSEVDQSSITGESMSVAKTVGDEVFAGTVNGSGALVVEVDRPAEEFVVARIVELVASASATKADRQLFIERVEQRYSVGVVVATVALFAVPLLFGASLDEALLRAMTFMIVASPCAVVLATMPPLLASIANAGRHGVLVKSAVVMEQLADVTRVAFDKTGTLTHGAPQVADVVLASGAVFSRDEIVGWAAAVEARSEHPIGRAIAAAAPTNRVAEATRFESLPGRGVRGCVEGRVIEVGDPLRLGLPIPEDLPSTGGPGDLRGASVVAVAVDGTVAAVIMLTDTIRSGAAETVAALGDMTGQPTVMLTGDGPNAATAVAAEVRIDDVTAGLLPAEKVDVVRTSQRHGDRVMLVGDGINDAPALAAADVGVAMGGAGADLALDAADAVVVGDDLAALVPLVHIAHRARRVVTQNLVFATSVIGVLVAIDLFATLPLPLGVAGHEGSTIVVALNGLRLLSRRSWAPSRPTERH